MTEWPVTGLSAMARGLVALGLSLACAHPTLAAQPLKSATAIGASAPVLGSGTPWGSLSVKQRHALQPLAALWPSMEATSKDRWVIVANRFDSLSPQEQQRMQDRMTQWSRLPGQQRGEARLRFQQTRQLSAEERQKKWASYQALPPQERVDLAQQARRKQHPVLLGDNMAGPREQGQPVSVRHRDAAPPGKSNWVPGAGPNAPTQVSVAPTLVKAGRGATTTLVSQRPTPPLHQQTGLTKIAANKGLVDPATLLPKKGAQAAAISAIPAASQVR